VVLAAAIHEPLTLCAQLGRLDFGDQDGVVAGLVLGGRPTFEPGERPLDERTTRALADVDPDPQRHGRNPAPCKVLCDRPLTSRQEARRPSARSAKRLVGGGVLPDRDSHQRRLERERDERSHGEAEALAVDLGRDDRDRRRKAAHHLSQLFTRHRLDDMDVSRRDVIELGLAGALVVAAAVAHFAHATPVFAFVVAALAIAILARLVGSATDQLGSRLGSSVAGVIQSALGNLPELFIALFALHEGLVRVVQSALVGSVIANSVLVLGIAFVAGGIRHGTQTFDSPRARMIATLTIVGAAILAVPTLTHAVHAPAAGHAKSLSLICAGVLIALFFLTLPGFLAGGEEAAPSPLRWTLFTTVAVLGSAGVAAAFVSDWFVTALKPATETLGMSQTFAGLVVVAIAGNAVENVVGVQLAARNRPDFAISVIVNSALQVALLLTPVLVFSSLLFATTLTLVFPTLLAISLLLAAWILAVVVYDGESTWEEGAILIGFYTVIAASFWWGG
jgi:Ca2+:H+ antiporter